MQSRSVMYNSMSHPPISFLKSSVHYVLSSHVLPTFSCMSLLMWSMTSPLLTSTRGRTSYTLRYGELNPCWWKDTDVNGIRWVMIHKHMTDTQPDKYIMIRQDLILDLHTYIIHTQLWGRLVTSISVPCRHIFRAKVREDQAEGGR